MAMVAFDAALRYAHVVSSKVIDMMQLGAVQMLTSLL